MGFAPRKNPEIVVVALIPGGEHGDRAAPIVRDVVKAYYDKKARMASMSQAAEVRQRVGAILGLAMPVAVSRGEVIP